MRMARAKVSGGPVRLSGGMHPKVGGGMKIQKAKRSPIPSLPVKAANPFKSAKVLTHRSTGYSHIPKKGGPY
jgi:hypothetical protein